MPIRFNPATDRTRIETDPTVPVNRPDYDVESEQSSTSEVLKTVNSTLEALTSGAEDKALGQYAAAATDVVSQTEGYAAEREKILQDLATADPKDKQAIASYYDQLSRLRRGETQGALSPSAASARINNLTKSYLSRYPQNATKIRQIHSGVMNDVGQVSGFTGGTDPDMAAIEDLTKVATTKGWSVQEEVAYRNSQATADVQKLDFEARSRAGVATQGDVQKNVLGHLDVFYKDAIPRIANAMKDPNFTGKAIIGDLYLTKAKITQEVNTALADIQVQHNITYTKDFQEQLLRQATDPIDQMIQMADKTDNLQVRTAISDNLRKLGANSDIAKLRRDLGPQVTYLLGTPDLYKFAANAYATRDKIKHGLEPTLRVLAQTDFQTKMVLDYLQDSGQLDQLIADSALAVNQDKDLPETGSPVLNKVQLQAAVDAALAPGTEVDTSGNMLTTAARNPNIFEAFDKRNDAVTRAKQFPKILPVLKTTSVKILGSAISTMGVDDANKIIFRPSNPSTPFTLPVGVAPFILGENSDLSKYSGDVSPKTQTAIDKLNQHYRVFSKLMAPNDLQEWAEVTLNDIKDSRVPGYQPTPKLPVEVAPPLPGEDTSATAEDYVPAVTPEEAAAYNPTPVKAPGMLEKGNIDLDGRVAVDNADGSISTLQSITIEEEGKYILIPTLNPAGKKLSDEDAVTLYHYTGDHLGIFNSEVAADKFAKRLSQYMGTIK